MRKTLALLLVAVMCLSLVACGDGSGNTETPSGGKNTNNQGSDNNGNNSEKIERGTVTTSENPLLPILFQTLSDEGWSYTFNEDGTCADQVYWWIERDTENSMTVMIASEYKWKYQIGIWYDAPYVSIQANNATYNGDDFVAWQPPMKVYRIPYVGGTNPALSKAYGTWVPDGRPENYFTEFTINEDGTCIVDGISTIWSISKFSDDRHIFIEFWDTEHNSSLGGAVVSVNGDGNSLQIFIPNGAIGGGIFVRKTN